MKKVDTAESRVKHDYTYLNDKYYVQSFWVTNKQ
ncbi:hypothetical protein QE417_004177 [Mucilaginibacter terrae]|uniref:Uncharacterized protein n=1 Tax=Mucilaginibacter terrae TaxID=1955052 RepID=A0ABU3GZB0_9SPHI|nr:hypothetical protein [Mucilaginibacter terrae]